MTSALFTPIDIGGLTLPNRISIAPMCQYSAVDGCATDWHIQHWMSMAMSGAGQIVVEATGVERRGRITHGCTGLYSDDNEASFARALAAARHYGHPNARYGVQLAHAGRKASSRLPWHGAGPLQPGEDPWPVVGPSAIPFGETGYQTPEALDEAAIETVVAAYAQAAVRARRAGFDFVELHGAHGYLIHSFLSPISNRRTDRWGGSFENRSRFARTILAEVRKAVPGMPVGIRISALDRVEGGWTIEDSVRFATILKDEGIAFVCCSSGGVSPAVAPIPSDLTQAGYAEPVRRGSGVVTRAVGFIKDSETAERLVAEGRADIVAIARAWLADPRWPWRAAAAAQEPFEIIPQYRRSGAFVAHSLAAPHVGAPEPARRAG
jgi:2,4-dienoyl-CoA reductase-like NADH-dependent reductase (Old Yellow Enzyme family)